MHKEVKWHYGMTCIKLISYLHDMIVLYSGMWRHVVALVTKSAVSSLYCGTHCKHHQACFTFLLLQQRSTTAAWRHIRRVQYNQIVKLSILWFKGYSRLYTAVSWCFHHNNTLHESVLQEQRVNGVCQAHVHVQYLVWDQKIVTVIRSSVIRYTLAAMW